MWGWCEETSGISAALSEVSARCPGYLAGTVGAVVSGYPLVSLRNPREVVYGYHGYPDVSAVRGCPTIVGSARQVGVWPKVLK